MSYIENSLVSGEKLIFDTKLHWSVIVSPALNMLALFILLGAGWIVLDPSGSRRLELGALISRSAICTTPLLLVMLLFGILLYNSSEFGVTNRRVLIKTGIVRRRTLELNLDKIESFQVDEPLMGRLFGYSSLVLTGSGGTHQVFHKVVKGAMFRKQVMEVSTQAKQGLYGQPRVSGEIIDRDPIASMSARQFERARKLYQSGKKTEAIAILEMLADQGYGRAADALRKIRVH